MNFDILNELMEIPKKTEASKAKKKLYVEQIGLLLSENGISKDAVNYLKKGFSFAEAKPVVIYLQKLPKEQRSSEIAKLLSSDIFKGGDKLLAFRFSISLAAYSIKKLGDDQQLLWSLIKVVPFVSVNKEHKLLKDAPKIFEKCFLDVISDVAELPCIASSGLKDRCVTEFRRLIEELVNLVSPSYQEKALRIREWVSGSPAVLQSAPSTDLSARGSERKEVVSNDSSAPPKNADEGKTLPSAEVEIPTKKAAPLTQKELANVIAFLGEFAGRLEVTATEWYAEKRELYKAKEQIPELQERCRQLESQVENGKKRNEQITAELEQRSGTISNLQAQLLEARETIARLEKNAEDALAENTRLHSIISVYSSDKQSSQSEQLNAIASKLKSEYRDFMDVENEEMTIDLGNNFRCQIQSIFRILAKAGIDVERR